MIEIDSALSEESCDVFEGFPGVVETVVRTAVFVGRPGDDKLTPWDHRILISLLCVCVFVGVIEEKGRERGRKESDQTQTQ